MRDDIGPITNFTDKVFLTIEGTVYWGELTLSVDAEPCVKLFCSSIFYQNCNISDLSCESGNGDKYTLFNCELIGNTVYFTHLSTGTYLSKIKTISVNLTTFTSWYSSFELFEIENEVLSKALNKNKFEFDFNIKKKQFTAKTNNCFHTYTDSEKNSVIAEFVTISISSKKHSLEYDECIELAIDLSKLFSILFSLPVSIRNVWISNGQSDENLYFRHFLGGVENYDSHKVFITHKIKNSNSIFHDIFVSYFNKKQFKDIWCRLTPLYNYNGFWEYELLAYVSILDAYVSMYSKDKGVKLPDDKFKGLSEDLMCCLKKLTEESTTNELEVLSSIESSIKSIKNNSIVTFADKFSLLNSELSHNVKNVLSFSESEFKTLKRIRDSAAHASNVKLYKKGCISFELRIVNKLKLFLTYLAFRDLGVTDDDFLISLKTSHHKVFNSTIYDKVQLMKEIDPKCFFIVDNIPNLDEINKLNPVIIKNSEDSDLYSYDFDATKEMAKPHKFDEFETLTDYVSHTTGHNDVKYVGNAFIAIDSQRDDYKKSITYASLAN